MLYPTALPTIYNLIDPDSNLADPLYVASDGTPIGEGNNCEPPSYYAASTMLGELRDFEKKAIVIALATAYVGWLVFFGKRTTGRRMQSLR